MTRAEEYLRRKSAEVGAMAGQRGVEAAREKLLTLSTVHSRHMSNLAGSGRYKRDEYQVEWMRMHIQSLADWKPARGSYGEIYSLPAVPERLAKHPALKTVAELSKNLQDAQKALPFLHQTWDSKGRGSGVARDLYGYADNGRISVWQVRETNRRSSNGYLQIKKTYYLVTFSEGAKEIPPHKIKRAVAADPSPDSPIRALNGDLKLPAPGGDIWTCYKMVSVKSDGTMVSMFDGETQYRLGKQMRQKARGQHGGGYYVCFTPQLALQHGNEVRRCDETRDLPTVILECLAVGRGIRYGNKTAVGVLTPTRVFQEC